MKNGQKNIIVLTGGGVAPALNATVFGVMSKAREFDYKVYGGLRGWHSLVDPRGEIVDLNDMELCRWLSGCYGGSILRTSRTNPFKVDGGIDVLKSNIERHNIDGIVAIGGDDTLGAAHRLCTEHGLPVVAAPKTIDNDLSATYWTPGYPTAAKAVIDYIVSIRRTAYTTGKIYLIELYGGKAGWLCASAYYGGADIIVPPEKTVEIEKLVEIIKDRKKADDGLVIAVSHHAEFNESVAAAFEADQDSFGIQRKQLIVAGLREKLINAGVDCEIKVAAPGNFFSALDPIPNDGSLATQLGKRAVGLIEKGMFNEVAVVVRQDRCFDAATSPLGEAIDRYRKLGDEEFDFEELIPKKAFEEYLRSFVEFSSRGSGIHFPFNRI